MTSAGVRGLNERKRGINICCRLAGISFGFGSTTFTVNPLKKQAHRVVKNKSSYTDKNPTNDCTNPAGIIYKINEQNGKKENENKLFLLHLATQLSLTPMFPEHNILEAIGSSLSQLHLNKTVE